MSRQDLNRNTSLPSSPAALHRISKRRSNSTCLPNNPTGRRSRMLNEPSNSRILQDIVDQIYQRETREDGFDDTDTTSCSASVRELENMDADPAGSGTQANVGMPAESVIDSGMNNSLSSHCHGNACPSAEANEQPFRIMDLPTEIRLEIYRACLTRPHSILLSKRDKPTERQTRVRVTQRQGEPTLDATLQGGRRASDDSTLAAVFSQHAPSAWHARDGRAMIAYMQWGAVAGEEPPLPRSETESESEPGSEDEVDLYDTYSVISNESVEPSRQEDPLLVNILAASKTVFKEAHAVLYSENVFSLDLDTAYTTMRCLHQRSRRLIKHVELEIPSYHQILDKFQQTVRLSLRYCNGLKHVGIRLPFTQPGGDVSSASSAVVYANGFDILRWLPQKCDVTLRDNTSMEIDAVVKKHLHLARTLDQKGYARRQLVASYRGGPID